jgi:uncharacterized protein (DUF2249 family)
VSPNVATRSDAPTLSEEHSVLLWQTCAYADDLINAVQDRRRPVGHAHDAMLEFAHYRLLPYLADEERHLPSAQLRDGQLSQLVLDDHARIRHGVDHIEAARTRQLLAVAADGLVERLDRHLRREESWVIDPTAPTRTVGEDWAVPLLLCDEINIDTLPDEASTRLVLQRLGWMRDGDVVHLESSRDLHPLWCRQHASDPYSHVWVYERSGPDRWRARVTRRTTG